MGVKSATAIDFRGDNITSFESLEKIQLISMQQQKVYIYKIEKIKLITPVRVKMTGEI